VVDGCSRRRHVIVTTFAGTDYLCVIDNGNIEPGTIQVTSAQSCELAIWSTGIDVALTGEFVV